MNSWTIFNIFVQGLLGGWILTPKVKEFWAISRKIFNRNHREGKNKTHKLKIKTNFLSWTSSGREALHDNTCKKIRYDSFKIVMIHLLKSRRAINSGTLSSSLWVKRRDRGLCGHRGKRFRLCRPPLACLQGPSWSCCCCPCPNRSWCACCGRRTWACTGHTTRT